MRDNIKAIRPYQLGVIKKNSLISPWFFSVWRVPLLIVLGSWFCLLGGVFLSINLHVFICIGCCRCLLMADVCLKTHPFFKNTMIWFCLFGFFFLLLWFVFPLTMQLIKKLPVTLWSIHSLSVPHVSQPTKLFY